jgi:hypothetical protein
MFKRVELAIRGQPPAGAPMSLLAHPALYIALTIYASRPFCGFGSCRGSRCRRPICGPRPAWPSSRFWAGMSLANAWGHCSGLGLH